MKKISLPEHIPFQRKDPYGAIAFPVYHTVAYEFEDAESMVKSFNGLSDDPDYSRVTNPTVIYLEKVVTELAGAKQCLAFTSGMAAIANTLMAVAAAGKNIVTSNHLFGNTYLLVAESLARFEVEMKAVDMTKPEEVAGAIDADTCCVYLETITNPQMEVADLAELSQICKSRNVPLIADTTMIPFTQYDGRKLGIDFEVVSSTKYISGGATSIGGLVIDYGNYPEIGRRLRKEMMLNFGAYMTPHVAYMHLVGIENLAVRYARQSESAMKVARALEDIPGVKKVTYPGLESNSYHEVAKRQFGGTFSAMLTIDLEDKEACFRFINNLKMIRRATNLFDNKTLAIHHASTIFGPLTDEQRKAMDIYDTTIRLSVGLEDPEDIVADIRQALS